MAMYEEQRPDTERPPKRRRPLGGAPEQLFAACTPNSEPVAGRAEYGYQINVLDEGMKILVTIDLPEWQKFRPASAGHRLIEHGYMIRPDARGPDTVNGWREVGMGFMVPVMRLDETGRPTTAAAVPDEDLARTERVSGSPVQRPGLLYADAPGLATPQHRGEAPKLSGIAKAVSELPPPPRPVDGPGCTPAFVPDEEDVMAASRKVLRDAMAEMEAEAGPPPKCCGHISCKGDGPCGYILAGLADGSVRCECEGGS